MTKVPRAETGALGRMEAVREHRFPKPFLASFELNRDGTFRVEQRSELLPETEVPTEAGVGVGSLVPRLAVQANVPPRVSAVSLDVDLSVDGVHQLPLWRTGFGAGVTPRRFIRDEVGQLVGVCQVHFAHATQLRDLAAAWSQHG